MQGFPSQKNQLLKKGNNGRPLTLKIDICKYPDSYPQIDTLCTKIERKIKWAHPKSVTTIWKFSWEMYHMNIFPILYLLITELLGGMRQTWKYIN